MLNKRKIVLKRKKRRRRIRQTKLFGLVLFIAMNAVAYMQAYRFTHFSNNPKITKKNSSEPLIKKVLFGVSNPRPVNKQWPKRFYETLLIQSNETIECWSIRQLNPKGTVILFHGYGSEKSSLLQQADVFLSYGYNTLLVDFMGSGGSDGQTTTIGFMEAQQVKSCYDFLRKQREKRIFLYGNSMGAVAITKAVSDYQLEPTGIILECPFGSMLNAVEKRFDVVGLPAFPMANLLTFWGGAQNGFWAFHHSPIEYAKGVDCPTLLMYGEQDDRVSRTEIDQIFNNLAGKKKLLTFPLAGHEHYLDKYNDLWVKEVGSFVGSN